MRKQETTRISNLNSSLGCLRIEVDAICKVGESFNVMPDTIIRVSSKGVQK